jgi:hypothetical protein
MQARYLLHYTCTPSVPGIDACAKGRAQSRHQLLTRMFTTSGAPESGNTSSLQTGDTRGKREKRHWYSSILSRGPKEKPSKPRHPIPPRASWSTPAAQPYPQRYGQLARCNGRWVLHAISSRKKSFFNDFLCGVPSPEVPSLRCALRQVPSPKSNVR